MRHSCSFARTFPEFEFESEFVQYYFMQEWGATEDALLRVFVYKILLYLLLQ